MSIKEPLIFCCNSLLVSVEVKAAGVSNDLKEAVVEDDVPLVSACAENVVPSISSQDCKHSPHQCVKNTSHPFSHDYLLGPSACCWSRGLFGVITV